MPLNLRQFREEPKFIGYLAAPASRTSDNTPAALDIGGYTNVLIAIQWGDGGITFTGTDKIEVKLRDGGSTVGAHAAVDSVDVVLPSGVSLGANGIVKDFVAAASAGARFLHYVGDQQYLSALVDYDGTHGAGTVVSVAVYGFGGRLNPPV